MGKSLNRHFSNEDIHMVNRYIIYHKVNENKNHNETFPPHTCYNGYYQKDKIFQVLVSTRIEGNPCTLEVPQKFKIELSHDP